MIDFAFIFISLSAPRLLYSPQSPFLTTQFISARCLPRHLRFISRLRLSNRRKLSDAFFQIAPHGYYFGRSPLAGYDTFAHISASAPHISFHTQFLSHRFTALRFLRRIPASAFSAQNWRYFRPAYRGRWFSSSHCTSSISLRLISRYRRGAFSINRGGSTRPAEVFEFQFSARGFRAE